jgi:hypothetical protein
VNVGLSRVLEMAEASSDKDAHERKIVQSFGAQQEFQFVIPAPTNVEANEAANSVAVKSCDQEGDAIGLCLVGRRAQQFPVILNLPINVDAGLTHGLRPFPRLDTTD